MPGTKAVKLCLAARKSKALFGDCMANEYVITFGNLLIYLDAHIIHDS